ncbi:MAG: BMP family ABC transporter substrate-binding protein [Clostridia bacterium]|nr:BMP family ABC transporter substrate-binding protein [Clostridia bacterium]
MNRRILSILLALAMMLSMFAFVSCGKDSNTNTGDGEQTSASAETPFKTVDKADLKIGLITLHDDSSTYDANFIDAMYRALEDMGLDKSQLILYTGIAETEDCYNKAKDCVNQGCQVVFADSFGHEDYMIQAAIEYPEVRFCHATGTKAHSVNYDNFSNAFASIYEGRYAAGVAAGMKLNEMIADGKITADKAVMGYVGAYTYAEVMSGYTSFYLGAKSVCPSVTMKVKFTGSWYDYDKEKAAAESLISDGCVLISQHADSYGAPEACEAAGVPNVSYNGSTEATGPNTYIVSSKIDWAPYFEYMINCVMEGKVIDKDYTGTIATGSVKVLEINEAVAAEGTQKAVDDVIEQFKAGTLHVFDTENFKVGGKKLESYMADVDSDEKFEKDTEAIADGYFHESEFRSAPYFDVEIDGIELLDRNYG